MLNLASRTVPTDSKNPNFLIQKVLYYCEILGVCVCVCVDLYTKATVMFL